MRSWLPVVLLSAMGCSHDDAHPPSFMRDCLAPITRTCSGLAIVTPREPVPFSSIPAGPLLLRNGAIDVIEAPSLLQHYALDGSPPRFHATNNMLFTPPIAYGGVVVTDGQDLFGYSSGAEPRFLSWDASNHLVADVSVDAQFNFVDGIAAFQGLAFVALSSTIGSSFVVDSSGAIGAPQSTSDILPYVYGCGFVLGDGQSPNRSLTMMPLDGRAQLTATIPAYADPTRWPYDSHGVALATFSNPEQVFDGGGPCIVTVHVIFDDGRQELARDIPADCRPFSYKAPTILTTSFGAVLYMGNGTFVLLDTDASPVGQPVQIASKGDEADLAIVPAGAYAAVRVTETTNQPSSVDYFETVLGCAP